MAKRKREEATVSFHYLVREKRDEGVDPEIVPFTADQFKTFCERLIALPDIDLNDDETCKRLKATIDAPVEKCEQVNERTVFGRFRSLYSGHAYDNTDVGEIPHSSVSLTSSSHGDSVTYAMVGNRVGCHVNRGPDWWQVSFAEVRNLPPIPAKNR